MLKVKKNTYTKKKIFLRIMMNNNQETKVGKKSHISKVKAVPKLLKI